MKITVKLLSDLCTGSGETYNSMVDTDITYDRYGLPYIPARRIKGCIREAALEMKELQLITEKEYTELFGHAGNENSAFTLSNACIPDKEKLHEMLDACSFTELKSLQNVLQQYTSTRTQTAVNLNTGVADKNSLRTIRVIRKGLVFEAECHFIKQVSRPQILKQAVSLVKHMGMSRTRGLGLVDMKLTESDSQKKRTVNFEKAELREKNRIFYTIHLTSPMICKSAQGNQAVTQDYIAGSKVLGLLAGALGDKGYEKLLESEHEFIVSNAYILQQKKRCVPARISLQKEKDQPYEADGTMKVTDMLLVTSTEGFRNRQMTPASISYISQDGVAVSVETEISYHHQRPDNKATGKATGKDGSSFYQLAAISEGQAFGGYIYADRTQAEQIMDAVGNLQHVRMGYGRSSEFGAVEFTLDKTEPVTDQHELCTDAVLTLLSDVILYNEQGSATTDIRELEKTLRKVTKTTDLMIRQPFLRFETIGGYNVTWRRRKPVVYALGKGSTCLLHSDTGIDIGMLNQMQIGERAAEGYGEIRVEKIPASACVIIRKQAEDRMINELSGHIQTQLFGQLLQAEFERRMQKKVRDILESRENFCRKHMAGMKAAVSKLRLMTKNEASYEALLQQVDGIEKASKNSICKELADFVNPHVLARELTEEMQKEYKTDFESVWTEEEMFAHIYRNYIAELKYTVRRLEKGGKGE